MKSSISPATLCMVVTIGILWGLNWPAVKIMLAEISPLTLRAISFTFAAIILMAASRMFGFRLRPAERETTSLIFTGLFLLFGFNVSTAFGQLFTQTSNAAIIAYTMPSMTAVLSAVLLGDQLSKRLILAICVGLAGLSILAVDDITGLVKEPLGPALMLLAAFSWSIGNVLSQANKWVLLPLARAAWFFVISAVMTWPLALFFEPLELSRLPSAKTLWVLLFHVLGPMVACYIMWTTLLGKLPATMAAISTLLAPVVGVLSAIAILNEPMTLHKAIALFLIVVSIAIALIRPATMR